VRARKVRDSSRERLGKQARKNLPEPKTLCAKLTTIGGGTTQKLGCPIYVNPHMGTLGGQVQPVPHSTDFKNPLEHLPPQH
jgi:hypothetical protein